MRTVRRLLFIAAAIPAACWIAAASQRGPAPATRPPRPAPPTQTIGNVLTRRLDFNRFKSNIQKLAAFGTRFYNTKGNADARNWLQAELESYGYKVERHRFTAGETEVDSLYVTKVGTRYPDKMYIVSGHMDSNNYDSPDRSFAPGANDDASGSSIVMEAARVFAGSDVKTEYSIRFILWNAEEQGMVGSSAYVRDRRGSQGVEAPRGSGVYPEPSWLGMIQHDMMMFDHGLPPGDRQIPLADVDIEYTAADAFDGKAVELANFFLKANAQYATDYPAQIGDAMQATDSVPFAPYTAAISLRENRRGAEIGMGSNPHHHRSTDVYENYRDEDFRLGFNALQMTVGALSELAGVSGPR
jgi:Zn-dependent M28 family amino/carboxypeptidase